MISDPATSPKRVTDGPASTTCPADASGRDPVRGDRRGTRRGRAPALQLAAGRAPGRPDRASGHHPDAGHRAARRGALPAGADAPGGVAGSVPGPAGSPLPELRARAVARGEPLCRGRRAAHHGATGRARRPGRQAHTRRTRSSPSRWRSCTPPSGLRCSEQDSHATRNRWSWSTRPRFSARPRASSTDDPDADDTGRADDG